MLELVAEGGAYRWPDDVPLPHGVVDGERRFAMNTQHGGWTFGRLTQIRGLAVETIAVDEKLSYKPATRYRVVGDRNLLDFRESGYEMEGKVSVGGRKRRAFTGSILVVKKDDDGKDRLYNIAVLHIASPVVAKAHGLPSTDDIKPGSTDVIYLPAKP